MSYQIFRCYVALIVCSILVTMSGLMLIFNKWFPKARNTIAKHEKLAVRLILLFGLLGYGISVIGYLGVEKYVRDFDVFWMWSRMILDDGPRGFLTEYPPFGMYLLALSQLILRLFNFQDNLIVTSVIVKLPSILATLSISYLGYRWAKKEHSGAKPVLIMIILALNPAFLINASMWGQMDMVMIFFAILSLYYLKNKKLIPAVIFYTAGCLIKPQMIFFAPIFGVYVILYVLDKAKRRESLKKLALGIIISIAMFFLATLPFKESFTDIWLLDFFKHITNEHPVNTASAFNLFGLHGGSFIPDTNAFLFINYRVWGYIFIGLVCMLCAFLSIKNKERGNVFLLSAFCVAAVFTLGVSMHERYLLPAVGILAISMIYLKSEKPVMFTLAYTYLAVINQCIILFDLFGGKTWTFKLFSGISVTIFILFAIYTVYEVLRDKKIIKVDTNEGQT